MEIKIYKKRKSFWKIWAGVGGPLLLLTGVILVLLLHMAIAVLFQMQENRVTEIMREESDFLQEQIFTEQNKTVNSELLNMDIFHIVAALYDEKGDIIAVSDIVQYCEDDFFTQETYGEMMDNLSAGLLEENEMEQCSQKNWYGINYLYRQIPITVDKNEYILQYASIYSPWLEHRKDFGILGMFIIAFMALFSFVTAVFYHRIYKERIEMEEYYKQVSNHLAHELKTPLMAISGYAENLRENVHTEKKDYYAEAIMKNMKEMSNMIVDMLELTRKNP